MSKLSRLGLAGLIWICAACSSDAEQDVSEWQGSTPHFRLKGNYKGEELDLAIEGDAAQDLANLSCSREYQAPLVDGKLDLTKARFWEVKLVANVEIKGERRSFELEFKRQDFSKVALGSTMKVIPRDDAATPGPNELWFEWEWHNRATGDTVDERAAQQGSFLFGEFSGQADANGMIPDDSGTFGGFLTAKWSESETLTFSFTAKCGENEIESDE